MTRIGAGVVLALGLAAAGCGGGGSKTLSKEEYGKQLNQACVEAKADLQKAGSLSSPADLASKGPKLLTAFDGLISNVEKLEAPDEIKSESEQMVAEAKQLRGVVSQLIDSARKNDLTKVVQLGLKAQSQGNTLGALGTKLGAPTCARALP